MCYLYIGAKEGEGTDSEIFPIWYFDNRKSMELWPHEYYKENELLPLKRYLSFAGVYI